MIKVDKINKVFKANNAKKDTVAVFNASLNVKKGEIVCLIGPSGSGKSTLLRCIEGLEKPDSGHIYINNEMLDLNDFTSLKKLRAHMGFVFQHFNLFPNMNVMDNLTLALIHVFKMNKEDAILKATHLLKRVGLLDKKYEYPNNLSGGQKQRVAIARALCLNPDIMLFDEPTSALDPEMVIEVLEVIKELASEGMTMLIVTHEMGFCKTIADRIIFLEDGRIVEDSKASSFFNGPKSERASLFLSKVMY